MADVDPAAWRELNRSWWDERTPLHVASPLYDVDAFRAGRESLRPFELELLGDVSGLRLAHLQCHFGLDTLGWARHGASVVGLDFSQPAVDAANGLAADLGLDGRFVCADVYDAVDALGGERFDVVYTGLGALNWLPDLTAWASVVAALVRPGGRLLLAEFHPFSWVFGDGRDLDGFRVVDDYFGGGPSVWDEAGSYADLAADTVHNVTVEHQHPLAEVLSAVVGADFALEAFEEYDHTLFPQFPWLVEDADARCWRLPEGSPRIPLMYALVARRPAAGAA
ncbi:MAG: methyltransferase domain-containing protein [Actinobacteria bacterium]|nr:methyltransferase domain-containing protein [Actinomycetota bacterium]